MVPGLTGISEMIVGEADLVSRISGDSGLNVLSTPRLIQLLEAAAISAVSEFLPPGHLTLGIKINVKHLSATPVGMKVTAHALLKEVAGNRLYFLVDAVDEKEKVAEGEHERVIVKREVFLNRIKEKMAK